MYTETVKVRLSKGVILIVFSILIAVYLFLVENSNTAVLHSITPLIFFAFGLFRIVTINKFKSKYYRTETLADPISETEEQVIDHSEQVNKEIDKESGMKQSKLHTIELISVMILLLSAQILYALIETGKFADNMIFLVFMAYFLFDYFGRSKDIDTENKIFLSKFGGYSLIIFSPVLGILTHIKIGILGVSVTVTIFIAIIGILLLIQINELRKKGTESKDETAKP